MDENDKLYSEPFEKVIRKATRANNRPRTDEQLRKDEVKEAKNKDRADREIIISGLPSPSPEDAAKYDDEIERNGVGYGSS